MDANTNRLPRIFTLAVIGICALPLGLNLLGFDFGVQYGTVEVSQLTGSAVGDKEFARLSGAFSHTLLEWTAVAIALCAALLAFVHFQIKRDVATPVIGMALLCSGLMDAFHILAADRLLEATAANENLIPFTWAMSRLFRAVLMVACIGFVLAKPDLSFRHNRRAVLAASAGMAGIAYLVITACTSAPSLPRVMYPEALISRPYDVGPLILFLFAGGFVYTRFHNAAPSLFSHSLIVSTIPEVATQFYMAFGSVALYDNGFMVGHFLKIVAYSVPFGGLILDYVNTYHQEQSMIGRLREAQCELSGANEKLAASEIDLERRAAELEIGNARLHELDQLKTTFLSTVAHELRTPLAAIVSAAKIIQKHHQTKPDVVERFGPTIMTEGNRLTRLINDFLDLAKIEAGCVDWTDSDVDLAEIAEQATSGVSSLANETQVELTTEISASCPTLLADHDRLVQVLTNLLSNSIKHTPAGGRVTVSADLDGERIVMAVKDTGEGIPPEDVPKVFDRFYQAKGPQAKKKKASTGLGLSISREIVERHGGHIWVESELGAGTSFLFTLPTTPPATMTQNSGPTSASESNTAAIRVLLMLDDAATAERIEDIASSNEFEFRTCAHVEALADVVEGWKPDVLIASPDFAARLTNDAIEQLQSQGVGRVLTYCPGRGFVDVLRNDGANLLAVTLSRISQPGAKILVVEDDTRYRAALDFELKEAGYDVVCAGDGKEALELMATTRPDTMILDMVMPEMDGLTVLEELSGIGESDKPKIIVLTGMDDPDLAHVAETMGACAVLRKHDLDRPVFQAVTARLQRVLSPVFS